MLFVLGVFLSCCLVDPAGDGSTSRAEEHFPDAAGATSEWQSSVNVYVSGGELYWFQSLWSALLTARESFPSGHGRPSAVPETQVCFWVRERTPGYVVKVFFFFSTHCSNSFNCIFGRMSWHLDIVLLFCKNFCFFFFFYSALMHQSNNVDSRRCYQCVKFLVTLAQKYVHMQST